MILDVNIFFNNLYNTHKNIMMQRAFRILDSKCLAEDAVQTAFFRIYKNWHSYNKITEEDFLFLSLTIVKNVALNMKRDSLNQLKKLEMLVHVDDQDSVIEQILKLEQKDELHQCINKLLPSLSEVVISRLILGLNTEETAHVLKISKSTVKTRLYRAKAVLKKMIIANNIRNT